jgi:hypothetical protein
VRSGSSAATFGIGNAPMDVFRGPGINNFDITVAKNAALERVTNSANSVLKCTMHSTTRSSVSIDTGARFDAQGAQTNTLFGSYIAAADPRRVQFELRFRFTGTVLS